ncbi:MAG: ISKra4 family transposase [Proteobacteria bacterium]|nr:ISKra4 family transposase [Pseudomonadota bacterium]
MTAAIAISSLERPYDQGRQCFENTVEYLDSGETCSMSHSELERELEKKGRELMRILLQEHLNRRGPGRCEEPVCGVDGVERTRKRLQGRNLETVFGAVKVNRTGYGQEGIESLHPLDAELNLPNELYSLELRRRAAEEAAKNSFDETRESIDKATGGHVPKRQIEELVKRAALDFDAFYETRRFHPAEDGETGPILVISADGKGVVMHEKDLREQTRKAAANRAHKMGRRLSKGEKKNAKRMATVATVYTTEPVKRAPEDLVSEAGCTIKKEKRPRPERKRVWASLEKTPEQVIEEAFCEACHRDPASEKQWVALVDGDKTQIRILRRIAKEKGVDITIIVDIIHVIEYLWDAGRAFHPASGPELENWVRHRLREILQGKAGLMAGGMRRSATRRSLSSKVRKPVDTCANYLLNKSPFLHYEHYLSQGFPIATGVIEGACRHLVKDRMEVTGAKWRLAGAESVLRLRALRSSHDFDEYWGFHEACEYKRNHQDLYDNGVAPPTSGSHQSSKRGHLKVIK